MGALVSLARRVNTFARDTRTQHESALEGGTIAVLVGIYERLVHAISMASKALGNVARLRFREAGQRLREIDWGLILPLLIGIGVAIFTLASVISTLLDDHPEAMAGPFTGLVAASAWVTFRTHCLSSMSASLETLLVWRSTFYRCSRTTWESVWISSR